MRSKNKQRKVQFTATTAAAGTYSLFTIHKVIEGITDAQLLFYSVAPPCDRLTHEEMAEVHTIVGTQFLSVLFIAECSRLQS